LEKNLGPRAPEIRGPRILDRHNRLPKEKRYICANGDLTLPALLRYIGLMSNQRNKARKSGGKAPRKSPREGSPRFRAGAIHFMDGDMRFVKGCSLRDTTIACAICGALHHLSVVPHRSVNGEIVGTLYVCQACVSLFQDAVLHVTAAPATGA